MNRIQSKLALSMKNFLTTTEPKRNVPQRWRRGVGPEASIIPAVVPVPIVECVNPLANPLLPHRPGHRSIAGRVKTRGRNRPTRLLKVRSAPAWGDACRSGLYC